MTARDREGVERQLPTLLEGGFVERGGNLLTYGLPGRGKTHLVAAPGRELILRHGRNVTAADSCKTLSCAQPTRLPAGG